ncbi:MAG: CBS domain-containing protein [Candidatus Thermoplasmatota archaeon]
MIKRKVKERLLKEFYELKVEDIAEKRMWEIPLIADDEPISHVLSILDGKSHVWVVNNLDEKKLKGVITRHDVLQILAPPRVNYRLFGHPERFHHGTEGKAEDVMTKNAVTCSRGEKIEEVLQRMNRHGIRRVAIVEDGIIEGELTLARLIHKYYKALQYHPIAEDEE